MSADDVSPDEMGTNRHDEGDELERLLEGSANAREQHAELWTFVSDVQAMPAASPVAEDLHLAVMMSESSRLLADKGDPVVRPVSKAHGPASQVSGLPMRRSTPMVKLLLAKVMAPLVAVFTLMGGLAYAQALPDPLQNVVADAGGVVGLDLPDSDDGDVEDSDDGAAEDADDGIEDDSGTKDEIDVDEDVDDDGAADDATEDAQGDADEDEGTQGDDDQGEDADADEGTQGDEDQGGGGQDHDSQEDQDESTENEDESTENETDEESDESSGGSDEEEDASDEG